MGLLFNSADTVKICGKLNRRFSDEKLTQIRNDPERLAKFQNPTSNTRTLHRIAYKSGLWPTRRPTNNKAKRWFKFLKNIHDNNAPVARQIKQALHNGITAPSGSAFKYKALSFIAIEGTTLKFTTSELGDPSSLVLLLCLQTPRITGTAEHDPSATPDTGEDANQEPNDDDDSGLDPSAAAVTAARSAARTKKKR